MRPMVNYRLVNGKGQNGIDAIYMLYELSPATGQSFRDLGEARRNGREFLFFPKPGLNLKSCAASPYKKGPIRKRTRHPRGRADRADAGFFAALNFKVSPYLPARVWNSSALRRIEATAKFSSRWAVEEVPGIGSMTGERCSSHASAICRGVAWWCSAIRPSGEPGSPASRPLASG